MDEYSFAVSIFALMVSVSALLHSVYKSRVQARLEVVSTRSDLMTKVVALEIGYKNKLAHLEWIKRTAINVDMDRTHPEVFASINDQIEHFNEFLGFTNEHYQWLNNMTYPSHESLLVIHHYIDSLNQRVRSETDNLKELRSEIEELITKKTESLKANDEEGVK